MKKIFLILFLTLFIFDISFAIWEEYRKDNKRTGYNINDYSSLSDLYLLWSKQISSNGINISSPVIDEAFIYIGTQEGNLFKINKNTGEIASTYVADGEINASPLIKDGIIYFGTINGYIYALETNDFNIEKWKIKNSSSILSAPLYIISENNVYICFIDNIGNILLINPSNGVIINKQKVDDYIFSSPALMGNNIVIITSSGKIVSADNLASAINVLYFMSDNFYSVPIIKNNESIFATNFNGNIFLINKNNPSLSISTKLNGKIKTLPIYDYSNNMFIVSSINNQLGQLYFFDDENLSVINSIPTKTPDDIGSGAANKTNIFTINKNGIIESYDKSGNPNGYLNIGVPILNSAIFDNCLILYDVNGYLHFYSDADAKIIYPNNYSHLDFLPNLLSIQGTAKSIRSPFIFYNLYYEHPNKGIKYITENNPNQVFYNELGLWSNIHSLDKGIYRLTLSVNEANESHNSSIYLSKGDFIYKGNLESPPAFGINGECSIDCDSFGNVYVLKNNTNEIRIFNNINKYIGFINIKDTINNFLPFYIKLLDDNTILILYDSYVRKCVKQGGTWALTNNYIKFESQFASLCVYDYDNDGIKEIFAFNGGNIINIYKDNQWQDNYNTITPPLFSIGDTIFDSDKRWNSPMRIYVKDDYLYIANFGNDTINIYSLKDFSFVRKIGKLNIDYIKDNGYLTKPFDLIVGNDDLLYVVEEGVPGNNSLFTSGHRVQVFTKNGEFVSVIGELGNWPGFFRSPTRIAFYDDFIYVYDKTNERIQKFETKVEIPKVKITAPINGRMEEFNGLYGIADITGRIPENGFDNYKLEIEKTNGNDKRILKTSYTPITTINQIYNNLNINEYSDGFYKFNLIVKDNEGKEFKDKTVISKGPFQYLYTIGSIRGTGIGEFNFPAGVAEYNNDLYIIDRENNRIKLYKMNGAYNGIAFNNTTNIKLFDIAFYNDWLLIIGENKNNNNNYIISWLKYNNITKLWEQSGYNNNLSVTYSESVSDIFLDGNNLYAVASGWQGIAKRFLLKENNGTLNLMEDTNWIITDLRRPNGIYVDNNYVYIACKMYSDSEIQSEYLNKSFIAIYDKNIISSPTPIATIGNFNKLSDICGYDQFLLTTDKYDKKIYVLSKEGIRLYEFGESGNLENAVGQFAEPIRISYLDNGNIYVSDNKNNRIDIFKPYLNEINLTFAPTKIITPTFTVTSSLFVTDTPTFTITLTHTITPTFTETPYGLIAFDHFDDNIWTDKWIATNPWWNTVESGTTIKFTDIGWCAQRSNNIKMNINQSYGQIIAKVKTTSAQTGIGITMMAIENNTYPLCIEGVTALLAPDGYFKIISYKPNTDNYITLASTENLNLKYGIDKYYIIYMQVQNIDNNIFIIANFYDENYKFIVRLNSNLPADYNTNGTYAGITVFKTHLICYGYAEADWIKIYNNDVLLLTPTITPTITITLTPTPTFTNTIYETATPTFTFTHTITISISPTSTFTWTPTATCSPTDTGTATSTITQTWTNIPDTFTKTITLTITPTFTMTVIPGELLFFDNFDDNIWSDKWLRNPDNQWIVNEYDNYLTINRDYIYRLVYDTQYFNNIKSIMARFMIDSRYSSNILYGEICFGIYPSSNTKISAGLKRVEKDTGKWVRKFYLKLITNNNIYEVETDNEYIWNLDKFYIIQLIKENNSKFIAKLYDECGVLATLQIEQYVPDLPETYGIYAYYGTEMLVDWFGVYATEQFPSLYCTETYTSTFTFTITETNSQTFTITPTFTITETYTETPSVTITSTKTSTVTLTFTPTITPFIGDMFLYDHFDNDIWEDYWDKLFGGYFNILESGTEININNSLPYEALCILNRNILILNNGEISARLKLLTDITEAGICINNSIENYTNYAVILTGTGKLRIITGYNEILLETEIPMFTLGEYYVIQLMYDINGINVKLYNNIQEKILEVSYIPTPFITPFINSAGIWVYKPAETGNSGVLFDWIQGHIYHMPIYTLTVTPTFTFTYTISETSTKTSTPTDSPTETFTYTVTSSPTFTTTSTMSFTNTTTVTFSPTLTFTLTPTITPYLLQVDCGATTVYIGHDGSYWYPDKEYSPGDWGFSSPTPVISTNGTNRLISNTSDDPLFWTQRWLGNNFYYRFDNIEDGLYKVSLYFAENYLSSANERIFDVKINGQLVLYNFDIYNSAGGKYKAYISETILAVTNGYIQIDFIKKIENPSIDAIKIEKITELTPTTTITLTNTSTITPTNTCTNSVTSSSTPSATPTVTSSVTPTITSTVTPTITPTVTLTIPLTMMLTVTLSVTPTNTPLVSPTVTLTLTETVSPSPTLTFSLTLTSTHTATTSKTASPSGTLTVIETVTPSVTSTNTPTVTLTNTPSATPIVTETVIMTEILTILPTVTITMTSTITSTQTRTATLTGTNTRTYTITPTSTPYILQVNCGGGSYTSGTSGYWQADKEYTAGSWGYTGTGSISGMGSSIDIGGTLDDNIYRVYRYWIGGNGMYRFDVGNGIYRVTLKFAEVYFSASDRRVFSVKIEGEEKIRNFDIYADAGRDQAVDRVIDVEVRDGQLNIEFVKVIENPMINAIKVEYIGSSMGEVATLTITQTRTATITPIVSPTATRTIIQAVTLTVTPTFTSTITHTITNSITSTVSPTGTTTDTITQIATNSYTTTPSFSTIITSTQQPTNTLTPTPPGCVVLDTGFGSNGIVTHHNAGGGNGADNGESIIITKSQDIYVTGSSARSVGPYSENIMTLWKINNIGNVSVAFTYYTGNRNSGASLAEDSSGNIWITGAIATAIGESAIDMALWKYDPVNTIGMLKLQYDNATGTNPGGFDTARSIKTYINPATNKEKVIIAGYSYNTISSNYDMTIYKYDIDTSVLDTSFGNNGVIVYNYGYNDFGYGIAVDKNNPVKIYVTGEVYDGIKYNMALWKYNDDGTPDTNFGNNGIVLFNDSNDYRYTGYDLTLDKFGNIYVTGSRALADAYDVAIWKYDSSGNKVWGPVLYDNGGYDEGFGIEIDTCGRILVTGVTDGHLVVLRYANNGTPDLTFGNGSEAIPYYDITGYTEGKRIAVYNDYNSSQGNYGKIVITGSAYMENNGMDMAVLRYIDNCDVCIPVPTVTDTPTLLPTVTLTNTVVPSSTASATEVISLTETLTLTLSPSLTATLTQTITNTISKTPTLITTPAATPEGMSVYPGSGTDVASSLTEGGSFAIAGRTDSFGAGGFDVFMLKTDNVGNEQSRTVYGGADNDAGNSIVWTGDGYLIAGETTSSGAGGKDVYLIKIDVNGNMEWTKTYGGAGDDVAYSIAGASFANTYMLVGYTSESETNKNIYLLYIDNYGNNLWNEILGGEPDDIAYSVIGLSNGDFVVVGVTVTFGINGTDVFLLRISNSILPIPTYTVTASVTFVIPSLTSTITPSPTITETRTPTLTRTITLTNTFTTTPSKTKTFTYTRTNTLTQTPTNTKTFTKTPTFTCTITPTLTETPALVSVQIEYKSGDNSQWTTSPHPFIRIFNTNTVPLDLSRVLIKYWYKYEGTGQQEQVWCDWAGKMPSGVAITGNTHLQILQGVFGAAQDRCMIVTFDTGAGSVSPGWYADINTRFNKTDWSQYYQPNDYSYSNYSNYTQWNKIAVYYDNILVWGAEPLGPASVSKEKNNNYEFNEKNVYVYPNPCSDKAIFRFAIDKQEEVKIEIYDLNGAVIWRKKLELYEIRIGLNYVMWDLKNKDDLLIANGIYIYSLETKQKKITKKMVIIK